MDFLNKKTIIGIIIIILLINTVGLGVFYYLNIYNPSDILSRVDKEECLRDIEAMNDDELINQANSSGNVPIRDMIDYLICKVEYDRSEENYIRAKNFVERISYSSEKNRQSVSNRLEEIYLGKNLFFTNVLATGDLSEVCPEKLSEICLNSIPIEIYQNRELELEYFCGNVCELINDENFVKTEVKDFLGPTHGENWSFDLPAEGGSYEWRIALMYGLEGRDSAIKLCDKLPDNSDIENCYELINQFDKPNCSEFLSNIEQVVCEN